MAQDHGHDHDEDHEDSHWHAGGDSHDSHTWHEAHWHAWDNHGWKRHSDHAEDHTNHAETSEEPIEPAGIVNDLSFSLEPEIDLTWFFVFAKTTTVEHNNDPVFRDLLPLSLSHKIDLSHRLILSIDPGNDRPAMADIYPKHRYSPKLFRLRNTEFAPRFETIQLYKPLPPVQENSFDLRTLPIIETKNTYPDLYVLPATIQRRMRHIRLRHGKKILKATAAVIITGSIFTGTLSAMTIFAKNNIVEGYSELLQLSMSGETSQIKRQISSIRQKFERASWLFLPMRYLVGNGIIRHEALENGYHALYAGTAVAELLTLTDGIQDDFSVAHSWATLTGYLDPRMFLSTRIPITDYLKDHRKDLSDIRKYISQAQFHFSSITTTGDPHHDIQLAKLTSLLKRIESLAANAELHSDEILDILGDKKPMNYLILNQNRDELRANWGFPGSAVEVSFYKGRLEKFAKKDIYFYDWHLFPYGEVPPPGISQIAKTWWIRDANYFPDIQQSFEVIGRMYEKAGGNSLDGLVAINQWLVEDILAVTWPVRVLGVPDEIDESSFSILLSVLVEGEYGRKNSAKDILFLTMEAIQNKLIEDKKFDIYAEKIQNSINSWQVLVAMRNDRDRKFVTEIFWKPKFRDNPDNFVYPVFTSLSGNKSDRYMLRTFDISNLSQSGCVSINRFWITSEHAFSLTERERIRNLLYQYGVDPKDHEHELYVQWNGDNVQYVRLLIPKNSSFVGISKELEGAFQWNVQNPEYDEVSFMITTGVEKTSSMYIDYTTTPTSCRPEIQFIEQPGLKNFKVRTP